MNIIRQGIRRQVLVPLTLTFLVLLGTFFFSSLRIRHINVVHELGHRYEGVRALSAELLDYRADLFEALAIQLARDEGLQVAMSTANRERLLELSAPVYQQLFDRHGLTHLYFHAPDATNFLRVHSPKDYDDVIDRYTLLQAIASGQITSGTELGPLGTFSLRLVYPWHNQGQLIGYIELGENLDRVVKQLKRITEIDFIVTIEKSHLDRDIWKEHRLARGLPSDWDLLDDRAIAEMTLDGIPQGLLSALEDSHRHTDLVSRVSLNQRTYALRIYPLFDAAETEVGDFLLLYDITNEMTGFNRFIAQVFSFGVFLCVGLFWFAYRILGQTDRTLDTTQEKLVAEITNAREINLEMQQQVAERHRVEIDLKLLNEQLEQRVEQRTAELQELNREIEGGRQELATAYDDLKAKQTTILHQDKMASIGLLAAGVAHDINNPIGFVTSNLQELREYMPKIRQVIALQDAILRDSEESPLLAELQQLRDQMAFDEVLDDLDVLVQESLDGSERVSKIVNNLRMFSRVDDTDFKPADINECLESTINITSNELKYKAVVIREYGKLPPLLCYPQQLNQVFMNLLINAAHAIEERGEVRVRTWHDRDAIGIRIEDTGCGIPEEELEKIFEPFFTTKDVGKGTGLGLSITYDIIHRHRGTIKVESRVGQGAAFTIRLPLVSKGDTDVPPVTTFVR